MNTDRTCEVKEWTTYVQKKKGFLWSFFSKWLNILEFIFKKDHCQIQNKGNIIEVVGQRTPKQKEVLI